MALEIVAQAWSVDDGVPGAAVVAVGRGGLPLATRIAAVAELPESRIAMWCPATPTILFDNRSAEYAAPSLTGRLVIVAAGLVCSGQSIAAAHDTVRQAGARVTMLVAGAIHEPTWWQHNNVEPAALLAFIGAIGRSVWISLPGSPC
ncbi:phosphoribosyltransferase [Crossiella sp. SN42]|uniref:phosphoribosyltransferase n=1 Tax=Crossiella sp. SN42 TaxID=2944808 RepID=UPI00207C53D8|nr:phosphoribosyltransferase [Crossiella sp. SN42]MCO1575517.1 phosphoribosyltransferase [Crossiella sp. SN42]